MMGTMTQQPAGKTPSAARVALGNDESGAALVEFALIAPMVLGLVLSTLELGVAEFVSVGFNNAVNSAARHIRTGQTADAAAADDFKALICDAMVSEPTQCLSRLRISVQRYADFASAGRDAVHPAAEPLADDFDAGRAGDIILVTATYAWPMMTPFTGEAFPRDADGNVQLTARLLFKNEPYS
jgi:Flp pilus assembly protein TadG